MQRIGSVFLILGIQIKRESGVNPGQSRCCEAPFNILKITYATDDSVDSGKLTVDSLPVCIYLSTVTCQLSTIASGRLQNGSKSEDLPFIKGSYLRGLGYGFEKIVYYKKYQIMEKDCPRCGIFRKYFYACEVNPRYKRLKH